MPANPPVEAYGLSDIDKALAEASLYEFVQQAWPVIEPATPFVPGWHIQAICEHLEAVTSGQIRDLIINVPPGCTKSITVCVMWNAWDWIRHPWRRYLTASYALRLAIRDTIKCRELIGSEWYQGNWGNRFHVTGDAAGHFKTNRTGHRQCLSVGSAVTGFKGDILICDDAHNVTEVESDVQRQTVLDWWDQSFYNRSNDLRKGPHVLIGQMTHYDDLYNHLLAQGGYEHLMIPEEFESDRRCKTSIGWQDPRTEDGELMRPERFDAAEVKRTLHRLTPYGYAAQHQQRPSPRKGAMFDPANFTIVDAAPAGMMPLRYWDKAATAGGGCYSCGVKMARDAQGFFYVLDVVRGQWSALERNRMMKLTAQLDGEDVQIWIEREPAAGGKESAEISVRDLAGWNVRVEDPVGNKESRAMPYSAQVEAKNVRLLKADWNAAYLHELSQFPKGRYADQVDASSGAFNKIMAGATDFNFSAGGGSDSFGGFFENAPSGLSSEAKPW